MSDSSATHNNVSNLSSASEEDLARRVQDGCADSFTALVERMRPRLLYVLCRRMQHYADAEDVAQKTLFRAYEKIHLYNPSRRFSPWLFTIALRIATDDHRKKRIPTDGSPDLVLAAVDSEPNPAEQATRREHSDSIWNVAERVLKPDQWTALWLLYGEGQSVKDIAQALNRTTVSIRVLLFRARKVLAPHLAAFADSTHGSGQDRASGEFIHPLAPQVVRADT